MNFKPLGDRILIKALDAKEQTKGGIILPDAAREKPQEGKVIAAGPGKMSDEGKTIAMSLKVGDKVLYGKYSSTEIKIEGEDYLIIREDDVLGIIG